MADTARITGIDDVLRRLGNVKRATANRLVRKAVNSASKPVLDDMKALVPERDPRTTPSNIHPRKLLRKSLGRKAKTYRNSGTSVAIVGPRTKRKEQIGVRVKGPHAGEAIYEDPSKIAHLVERGTKDAAAQPFARPAYDRNKERSAGIMRDELLNGIEEVAKQ